MAKILDFKTKYAPKIFAIDPGFSTEEGCGWAIINCDAQKYGGNKNSPLVLRSGNIKPFANISSLQNMIELAHKLERIWEEDSGFSRQPKTVVVEKPNIDLSAPLNPESIRDLAIFVGVLIKIFVPELILAPTVKEWSDALSKEETQKYIFNCSDKISLKNINRDISCIALNNRHNVYDAIGLGIYGGNVTNNQLPFPETFLRI